MNKFIYNTIFEQYTHEEVQEIADNIINMSNGIVFFVHNNDKDSEFVKLVADAYSVVDKTHEPYALMTEFQEALEYMNSIEFASIINWSSSDDLAVLNLFLLTLGNIGTKNLGAVFSMTCNLIYKDITLTYKAKFGTLDGMAEKIMGGK